MKIFLINLGRSVQRLEAMTAALAAVGLPFERFAAIDGNAADELPFLRFDDERSRWVRGIALAPGERGAAASHVALWRRCVELAEPIVVMEDDVYVGGALPAVLETVAGRVERYGLLRLFMFFPRPSRVVESLGGIEIARYRRGGTGLQCYAIAPPAAAALLAGASPMLFPVDVYVERFWVHGVIPYAVHPFPVGLRDYAEFPSEIGYRQERQRSPGRRLRREVFRAVDDARRALFNLTHR